MEDKVMTKIYKVLTSHCDGSNSTIFVNLSKARNYASSAAVGWDSVWIFESTGESDGQVVWEKLETIR